MMQTETATLPDDLNDGVTHHTATKPDLYQGDDGKVVEGDEAIKAEMTGLMEEFVSAADDMYRARDEAQLYWLYRGVELMRLAEAHRDIFDDTFGFGFRDEGKPLHVRIVNEALHRWGELEADDGNDEAWQEFSPNLCARYASTLAWFCDRELCPTDNADDAVKLAIDAGGMAKIAKAYNAKVAGPVKTAQRVESAKRGAAKRNANRGHTGQSRPQPKPATVTITPEQKATAEAQIREKVASIQEAQAARAEAIDDETDDDEDPEMVRPWRNNTFGDFFHNDDNEIIGEVLDRIPSVEDREKLIDLIDYSLKMFVREAMENERLRKHYVAMGLDWPPEMQGGRRT
jgi:hypothetical protein